MEIGAVLPHNEIGTDPGAIRAYAEGVEALGATHLLAYDHVLGADRDGGFEGPYDADVAFHEPLTTFSFMAAVTTRVRFVTAILILPQRQTALVAKQTAEVAVLSGDRLSLGVGVGWNAVEYEALGIPFTDLGARQEEQVELLRALWTSPSVTFDGRFHTVTGASINPRPGRPIPVLFGGSAPGLLERCGRLGDGWVPLGKPDATARARLAEIRRAREAAGRTMEGFVIQAQAQYRGGTPQRWRTHAAAWQRLGATHLAIATHNAEPTDVDGHLARIAEYRSAVAAVTT